MHQQELDAEASVVDPTPVPNSLNSTKPATGEQIWSGIAERDDWSAFETKVAAIRRMGNAMTQDAPPA